jgi:hypothetical protein
MFIDPKGSPLLSQTGRPEPLARGHPWTAPSLILCVRDVLGARCRVTPCCAPLRLLGAGTRQSPRARGGGPAKVAR